MTDARLQQALDRAEGREWPATSTARVTLAIADRRVLAIEVRRLQRLLGLADPVVAARLDAALRAVAVVVTQEALDGGDRDPA